MINLLTQQNVFIFLLFLWTVSIPFKNAVYQGSTILLITFFLVYLIKNRDYKYFKSLFNDYKDLFISFSLIILSMSISNTINDFSNIDAWRLELNYIYRYALIFIILIYFFSKQFFSKQIFIIFIFISLGIQGLDGIFQSIMGFDIFKHNLGNLTVGLTGVTFNRNTFGFFVGLGVILSFLLIKKDFIFNKTNFIIYFSFIIFLFCTLFSYSRAVWSSLFILLFLYAIVNLKKINIKRIIIFIIFIIFVSIVFLNVDALQNRFDLLINGHTSRRNIIWFETMKLINEKLIFGWGLDSWKTYGMQKFAAPHNITLEILFNLGLFGLFLYMYFLFLAIKEIITKKDYSLLFFFLFILIVGQFDHSLFIAKTYLSTITILMFFIFMNRVEKDKK
jgi:O-antigen ligase